MGRHKLYKNVTEKEMDNEIEQQENSVNQDSHGEANDGIKRASCDPHDMKNRKLSDKHIEIPEDQKITGTWISKKSYK